MPFPIVRFSIESVYNNLNRIQNIWSPNVVEEFFIFLTFFTSAELTEIWCSSLYVGLRIGVTLQLFGWFWLYVSFISINVHFLDTLPSQYRSLINLLKQKSCERKTIWKYQKIKLPPRSIWKNTRRPFWKIVADEVMRWIYNVYVCNVSLYTCICVCAHLRLVCACVCVCVYEDALFSYDW